ncbi:MAG: HIT domain-containing protein [Ignavibacteriaceae bacterium]
MDKLWSPWRSQYIESFKDKTESNGCIFCEVKDKNPEDADNLLVHKAALTFTILNLYPYNNGHLMVVPYRHTDDFQSLTKEESTEIIDELKLAQLALLHVSGPQGFNIGVNMGKAAGAGIEEHLHFHLVPRWTGDTNFMPVIGEVKVISQDLLASKKQLLEAYKKIESAGRD